MSTKISKLPYFLEGNESSVRLFCFPYAGGGASVYYRWIDKFPTTIQVLPVQLPGREGRLHESMPNTLEGLIDTIYRDLQPFFDRPFYFFGHSFGAFIASNLSARLSARESQRLKGIFVSSRCSPASSPSVLTFHTDAELKSKLKSSVHDIFHEALLSQGLKKSDNHPAARANHSATSAG